MVLLSLPLQINHNLKCLLEMNEFGKIQQLIESCHSENIALAFQLAKSYDLEEEKILAPWKELIDFFLKEHLIKSDMDNIERLSTILNSKRIVFWSDNIICFPEKIGALRKLKYIGIEQNKLKELPKSFSSLLQLEEIWLWKNELEYLPEDIGKLSKLKKLYVHENQIKKIPKSIFKLQKLEKFVFYENLIPEEDIVAVKRELPNCKFDF